MPGNPKTKEEQEKESLQKLKLLEDRLREFEAASAENRKKITRTPAEKEAYKQERSQVMEQIIKEFQETRPNENMGYNQWVDAMLLLLNIFSAFARAIYVRPPIIGGLFTTRHENPLTFTELIHYVGSGLGKIPENIVSLAEQVGKPKNTAPEKVQYALEFSNRGNESYGRIALFSKNGFLRSFIENYQDELAPGGWASLRDWALKSNVPMVKSVIGEPLAKFVKELGINDAFPQIEAAFLSLLIEWSTENNIPAGAYTLRVETKEKNPDDPEDHMDEVLLCIESSDPGFAKKTDQERQELMRNYQQSMIDALNKTGDESFDNFLKRKLSNTNIALEFAAKGPMPLPEDAPSAGLKP